jgi:positive regulator of sigma E activity
MIMSAVFQHYQQRIDTTKAQLNKLKKQISLAAFIRLVCFLLLAWMVYQLFHGSSSIKIILALLSLAGFLASISWFVNLQNQQAAQKSLLEVLQISGIYDCRF